MAAFGRIGTGEKVKPKQIAYDISIALICTAMGLMTAIPFTFVLANLNIRVRILQDSLSSGMTRFLEHFKNVTAASRKRLRRKSRDVQAVPVQREENDNGRRSVARHRVPPPSPFEENVLVPHKPLVDDARFDVTAMVDLVFMMNIFFLVTWVETALAEIDLPTARHCSGRRPGQVGGR